jgi:O-antigen/teichoic acid export membrane protein
MRHVKRIVGFALLPGLSMLASLVLLPLVSARFGAAGWIALALGQSIGAIVSIVVGMAWPIVGGNAVARADGEETQQGIFRASVYSRGLALVVLLLIAIPLTLMLAHSYPVATTLFMVAIALNGLSAAWFFEGKGQPRSLVINEGLTRFVGYGIAVATLLAGARLSSYGAVMVVTGLATFALNWFTIMRRSPLRVAGGWGLTLRIIREHATGTVARLLQAAFTFGGPSIFALLAPAHLPLFSGLDQIQKAGTNASSFLPSSFVHWVGSAAPAQRRRNMLRSLGFSATVSALSVPVWMFIGPTILKLLFADKLQLSAWGHLLLILAIVSVLFRTSCELLVLVPLGYAQLVYAGSSIASVIGIVLVALGAVYFGALGGVGAWIAVHTSLVCAYGVVVVLHRRRTARS